MKQPRGRTGNSKTTTYFNLSIKEIRWEKNIKSILFQDRATSEIKGIATDAVFIYAGYLPATGFVKGLVDMDDKGYMHTDVMMRTSVTGIYVAGDVRTGNPAQTAIAVEDGARAALAMREVFQSQTKTSLTKG